MKKEKIIISLTVACLFLFSFEKNTANSDNIQTNESSVDTNEVKIGTQIWAAKNLDVSTFRNGDTIPEVKTNEEWVKAGEEGKPSWCYYDNNPENGKIYGKLYNWYAVSDPRGLAPKGWHVPADAEWTTLTDYLGGGAVAGTKMKSNNGWDDFGGQTGNGTSESGFAGFPGGDRYFNGEFEYIGSFGAWWSSSVGSTSAWHIGLNYGTGIVTSFSSRYYYSKSCGFSVRCLRD